MIVFMEHPNDMIFRCEACGVEWVKRMRHPTVAYAPDSVTRNTVCDDCKERVKKEKGRSYVKK